MSRDIAKQRNNHDYYIAHSSLADIENGKQLPSISKLYSLSVIYRRRYDELAAWCGVPIADAEKEHRALAFPRTYLVGTPAEDAERVILTASELRQKLRSEPTNLVPRNARQLERAGSRSAPAVSRLAQKPLRLCWDEGFDVIPHRASWFVRADRPTTEKDPIARLAWRP